MQGYQPGRALRVLTTLTTLAFYGFAVLAVILLMALPALKLLAGDSPQWVIGLTVPADIGYVDAAVRTNWGEVRLEIGDVQGSLKLPISILPGWLFVLLLSYTALMAALMLLFLHHLRRILQRVRDGAPFDPANAPRLRGLGLLALGFALLKGVAELVTALAVRSGVVSSSLNIPAGVSVDGSTVFFALVLLALAEAFRRGTELEDEQALVI